MKPPLLVFRSSANTLSQVIEDHVDVEVPFSLLVIGAEPYAK
jgi:hypothetical protein